jgi:uncharacterized membrane protein YhaH (DUF805 family)
MSFQDAVRACLQHRYADFNGRARRSEYWFFQLFAAVAYLAWLVGFVVFAADLLRLLWALVGLVVLVGLIVPGLAVFVRRMHDTGRSGWWWLLGFVPFGGLVLLVFTCLDSTPDNQYGPNPKGYALPYPQMPPPIAPA